MPSLADYNINVNIHNGAEEAVDNVAGVLHKLKPVEQEVWISLIRFSGHGPVNFETMASRIGITKNALKNALYSLQNKGFLYGMPDNE